MNVLILVGHEFDFFVDPFCCLCFVFVILSCLFPFHLCDKLLGKGWHLGCLVHAFCHFAIWYPGSGMVFDYIDS